MNYHDPDSSRHLEEFFEQYRINMARWETQLNALSSSLAGCTTQLELLTTRFAAIEAHLARLPSPEQWEEFARMREAMIRNAATMNLYVEEAELLRSEYSRLRLEYSELRQVFERR